MRGFIFGLVLGSIALLSAVAVAEESDAKKPDGKRPSREEFRKRTEDFRKRIMEKYDANKDGKIDEKERQAIHKAFAERRAKWMKQHRKSDNEKSSSDKKAPTGDRHIADTRITLGITVATNIIATTDTTAATDITGTTDTPTVDIMGITATIDIEVIEITINMVRDLPTADRKATEGTGRRSATESSNTSIRTKTAS